ncbi:MAG TPA: transposase [Candidatus Saccharimonadales bacterium]
MKLSYKYRIYPNKNQAESLQKNFNFCCFLYNCALQERNDHYKKFGKSVSYSSQCEALPYIKEIFADQVKPIYSQSLQQVLKRLDGSYKNFFRRVKDKASKAGFPRYKSADSYNSIVFPQADLKGGGVKLLDNNKLRVFGIDGDLKIKWHRPFQGRCKQVIIKKQADKFFLIISCTDVPLDILVKANKTTAIDLGLESFITTDDGTKFHHPKPYKTAKEKLAWLNRKLALKVRGSNNRKSIKKQLGKAYEKVSNVRQDFLHKIAKQFIAENDIVIIEKLNVKSMMESKSFAVGKANIQDASWASFAGILSYKAERAGRIIIEVDSRNTSKMCSQCKNVKEHMTLADRTYHCEVCDLAMDRDHNAALNIRRLGTSLAATVPVASEASNL